jgi:DNA-binding MarR family transcriptional regulator
VVAQESVAASATFLLGKLAAITTSRFAERLAGFGLRPRHCGVLEWLAAAPVTQLDLARALGVTPSVIVDMLDELESLDAVRRNRDPADRRRQIVELTPAGRALITKAAHAAHEVDTEFLRTLNSGPRADLLATLRQLAEENGLPTGSPSA